MKDLKTILETISRNDYSNPEHPGKSGNVLEVDFVSFKNKPVYYWHTPQSEDWKKFKSMKEWEIITNEMPERFYIKIGK